eukprot:13323618-Alexandrium_andersonii.AAC.1
MTRPSNLLSAVFVCSCSLEAARSCPGARRPPLPLRGAQPLLSPPLWRAAGGSSARCLLVLFYPAPHANKYNLQSMCVSGFLGRIIRGHMPA